MGDPCSLTLLEVLDKHAAVQKDKTVFASALPRARADHWLLAGTPAVVGGQDSLGPHLARRSNCIVAQSDRNYIFTTLS